MMKVNGICTINNFRVGSKRARLCFCAAWAGPKRFKVRAGPRHEPDLKLPARDRKQSRLEARLRKLGLGVRFSFGLPHKRREEGEERELGEGGEEEE